MSLFDRIFKPNRKKQEKVLDKGTKFVETTYGNTNYARWDGDLYRDELIRASIDAKARHISKLKVSIQGSAKKELTSKLLDAPNEWQTWSQFLYRTSTILDVANTCFIVPVYDKDFNEQGIFTLLPSKTEIVEYKGDLWVRYDLGHREKGAIEVSKCGILTKYQFRKEFYGEDNDALDNTMKLTYLETQAIKNAIKESGSYKFMAQVGNFTFADDLANERRRFTNENLGAEAVALLYPVKALGTVVEPQHRLEAVAKADDDGVDHLEHLGTDGDSRHSGVAVDAGIVIDGHGSQTENPLPPEGGHTLLQNPEIDNGGTGNIAGSDFQLAFGADEQAEQETHADALAQKGSRARAANAHIQPCQEHNVQHDVGDGSHDHGIQGGLAVPRQIFGGLSERRNIHALFLHQTGIAGVAGLAGQNGRQSQTGKGGEIRNGKALQPVFPGVLHDGLTEGMLAHPFERSGDLQKMLFIHPGDGAKVGDLGVTFGDRAGFVQHNGVDRMGGFQRLGFCLVAVEQQTIGAKPGQKSAQLLPDAACCTADCHRFSR